MVSVSPPPSLRVLPHHQDTGGFFIAVLHKSDQLPWQRRPQRTRVGSDADSHTSHGGSETPRPSVLGAEMEGEEEGRVKTVLYYQSLLVSPLSPSPSPNLSPRSSPPLTPPLLPPTSTPLPPPTSPPPSLPQLHPLLLPR